MTSQKTPIDRNLLKDLIEIGLAGAVEIAIMKNPDNTYTTQIGVAGKKLEEGPILIINHICEGLGFMLSKLRQAIQTKAIALTEEDFKDIVNTCKKHIDNAIIDYNEKE